MRLKFYHLIIIFLPLFSNGQHSLDYGNDGNAWLLCSSMQGSSFSSSNESIAVLDEILNTVGASRRFQLQACTNINNAVAITLQGVRYIMYDPEWIASLDYTQDWAGKFILAHEVGHHINGHTIDVMVLMNNNSVVPLYKKRIQELEADKFAGFVMANLGASLNEALIAVNRISDDSDDSNSTHPSRSKRIEAVTAGYNQGKGFKDNSSSLAKSPYSNTNYSGVYHTTYSGNDFLYEGTVSEASGAFFGFGKLTFTSGNIYEGEFANDKQNGFGKWTIASNGEVYEGQFVDGTFVSGIREVNGVIQRGTFNKNRDLNGFGSRTFSDGSYLEGYFKDGLVLEGTIIDQDDDTIQMGFNDRFNVDGFLEWKTSSGYNTVKAEFDNGKFVCSKNIVEKNPSVNYTKCYNVLKYFPESLVRELNIPTYPYKRGSNDCVPYSAEKQLGYFEQSLLDKYYYTGYGYHSQYYFIKAGFGISDYEKISDLVDLDGKRMYVGMWWNNDYNGEGVLYLEDGTVLQGVWHNGELIEEKKVDLNQMMKDLKDF